MNQYRKKTYYRKRNFNSNNRSNRRYKDTYHQPGKDEDSNLPCSRHTLTKGDVEAVVEALLSGTITQGKELDRFESLLAKLTHCHYALAVNSGTSAIHTALAAIGLKPGDEIITSTLNFCGVANMIKLMGGVPVLVDCDPEALTISVEEAKKAVTSKTKAIFANNFAGHPADMNALREICDEHNLALLEDASHGLGGRYKGHYIGNQADLTCFSFHPTRAITSGEGGAVTTNDVDKFAFMKMFRDHGIQRDADYFQSESFNPDFHQEVQFLGMNYRLNELQAALGRNQLTRLDRHIERRRAIAQVYRTHLGEDAAVILPSGADWADHAFHLFPIQLTGSMFGQRDKVFADFKANGIDVQVHYVPVHQMPLYKEENSGKDFPNADSYFQNCISLPLYPDLSIKELDKVIEILKKNIGTSQVEASASTEEVAPDSTQEQIVDSSQDNSNANVENSEDTPVETFVKPEKKSSPYRRRGRRKISSTPKVEGAPAPQTEEQKVTEQVVETSDAPKKAPSKRKPPGRKSVGRPARQKASTSQTSKVKETQESKAGAPEGVAKDELKPAKRKPAARKTTATKKPAAAKKRPAKARPSVEKVDATEKKSSGSKAKKGSEVEGESRPARKTKRVAKPKTAPKTVTDASKEPEKKKTTRKPRAKTVTASAPKKRKTPVKKTDPDKVS